MAFSVSRFMSTTYYDRAEHWTAERYTTGYERQRFLTLVGMVPPQTRSLLDVGTGNGAFLYFLEQTRPDISIVGLDSSRQAIADKLCKADIVHGSLDDLPFADGAFDVVSTLEVLEHVPSHLIPKATDELMRVARSAVLLGLPYRERRTRIKCPECNCGFDPYYHMRSYDDAAAAKLFRGLKYTNKTVLKDQRALIPYLIVNVLGAEMSARRFPNVVCPQCNWHNTPAASSGGLKASPSLAGRLWRMQPMISIERHVMWLVRKSDAIS
jgi:ubiquinone/menaquinone biosynthesis C-methylase UbiE